eukprot:15477979-Alexandrium_andersonii.AAC.1
MQDYGNNSEPRAMGSCSSGQQVGAWESAAARHCNARRHRHGDASAPWQRDCCTGRRRTNCKHADACTQTFEG